MGYPIVVSQVCSISVDDNQKGSLDLYVGGFLFHKNEAVMASRNVSFVHFKESESCDRIRRRGQYYKTIFAVIELP